MPVFNDESIYLDWAWSNTHMPGHLYDSLLDAKQPLMIWIFAFFENFFLDPLFAGRFASVLIGCASALGIYALAKKLFDKKIALTAALLYTVTPIFVFYNRQALMEAGVACLGIWSGYSLLNLLSKPSTKNGIVLGSVLGFGYFNKSSSLLFLASSLVVILYYLVKKHQSELIKPYGVSLITFLCVNLLLFINPVFWQTFSMNSRYSYTPAELFTFPVVAWVNHLLGFFEIGFIFVTPFTFLLGIIGVFILWKTKIKNGKVFITYFTIALVLEILSVKFQSQRYLVAFLPFFIIPAAYVFSSLWKGNILKKVLIVVSLFFPIILTTILLFNPEQYIMQLSKVSNKADTVYILGQTSGYGINETMQYIKTHASATLPNMVLFGLNIGNPESAVDVYSQRDTRLFGLHIDSKFFPGIEQYKCITSQYPVFFVTRDDQRGGMDRYFVLEKSFANPYSKYFINIYTLKKSCKGKTLSLSDTYQGAITRMIQLRSGSGY